MRVWDGHTAKHRTLTLFHMGINLPNSRPWTLDTSERFERDREHFEKKHPRELEACLRNALTRYLPMLNVAPNPRAVHAGFLHAEPAGVVAVDQKGGGGNLRETRLYTFADESTRTLHLLLLGDKSTQRRDLAHVRQWLKHHQDELP